MAREGPAGPVEPDPDRSLPGACRAHAGGQQRFRQPPLRHCALRGAAIGTDAIGDGPIRGMVQPGNGQPRPETSPGNRRYRASVFRANPPIRDGNGRTARALAEKAMARLVGRSSLIPVSELIHAAANNTTRHCRQFSTISTSRPG